MDIDPKGLDNSPDWKKKVKVTEDKPEELKPVEPVPLPEVKLNVKDGLQILKAFARTKALGMLNGENLPTGWTGVAILVIIIGIILALAL